MCLKQQTFIKVSRLIYHRQQINMLYVWSETPLLLCLLPAIDCSCFSWKFCLIDTNFNKLELPQCILPKLKGMYLMWNSAWRTCKFSSWTLNICIYHCMCGLHWNLMNPHTYFNSLLRPRLWILEFFSLRLQNLCTYSNPMTWNNTHTTQHSMSCTEISDPFFNFCSA